MQKVLITGVAGGLGKIVAERLGKSMQIVGVDHTPWVDHPAGLTMVMADLRKKKVEDVFRRERPDALVHLGLERHNFDPKLRHDVNVVGTKRVIEAAATYGVKKAIILTSSYVYGALPENPFYMDEETALNVSRHYPEIRDLAEMDGIATNFLWRYPEIHTAVLRPASTLGPRTHSSIATYLRLNPSPTLIGFDPLVQFIHERDVAEAIVMALTSGVRGVFNVVGPGAVPVSTAIRESGGFALPVPEAPTRLLLKNLFRWGLFPFPADAVDFIKYPCTIDGRRFREATGFQAQCSLGETLRSVRR